MHCSVRQSSLKMQAPGPATGSQGAASFGQRASNTTRRFSKSMQHAQRLLKPTNGSKRCAAGEQLAGLIFKPKGQLIRRLPNANDAAR